MASKTTTKTVDSGDVVKKTTGKAAPAAASAESESAKQYSDYEKLVADNAKKIADLEDTISQLRAMIGQMSNITVLQPMQAVQDDGVTIIFNTHGKLRTNFPTWTLSMSKFGQRVTITRNQFQELANNHRKYFDRQYILLDAKHMDLARNLGLTVYDASSNKFIKPEDIENLGKLSVRELEAYYDNLSEPMQRTLVGYVMNRCNERDPEFYNVEKMKLMNNLTHGNLFDYLIKLCVSEHTK